MTSRTDDIGFAYQPVVNLSTASVTALEILARPETGEVLAAARLDPRVDTELAGMAVRAAGRDRVLLPLHVNLFASTVAAAPRLAALGRAVREAGRSPWEITIDLGPPYAPVPQADLLAGVRTLRELGYRVCADGVGDGDVPLRLLTRLAPDLVKLDPSLVAEVPRDAAARAAVAAMRELCDGLGALLAAEGVETERQCAAAREAGAQLAQGNLFAPPARRPVTEVHRPSAPAPAGPADPRGPRIAQFVQPAALLPLSVSAGQVRALLTGSPGIAGVVLVDGDGVPVRAVHRDRFLLSLSGRYGHALYADRPAVRLADCPRTVPLDATAWEALDVVAADARSRTADDVAVVDGAGRCVGVVHLADIVRALAETRVEEAARLNPLTRLPGSDMVNTEVDRRIADGRAFALSWLDVDGFKQVNDGAGFAAGDELIRSVGRALADAAAGRRAARVGHIGGDDFLVLTDPDGPEGPDPIATAVLDASWSAGGLPVTMSLATVVCPPGSLTDHRQAAACLAPLKKAAKALRGPSWVLGRPGSAVREVRCGHRGRAAATGAAPVLGEAPGPAGVADAACG
ncbi:GGDEF domain-containing protein [Streptomyces sp. NPDC018031]|uniref:GGDEF domain-containing protein n=1 Tax=Streptomyces sp. NPDC018031 TaxID=3365033 RepID=UPI0037AC8A84